MTLLQIKIFNEASQGELQNQVNDFLFCRKRDRIVDIKYQFLWDVNSLAGGVYRYSAMVVYEVRE